MQPLKSALSPLALVALSVALLAGVPMAPNAAAADDGIDLCYTEESIRDSNLSLRLDLNSTWGTPWRYKTDDTPVYMNVTSMGTVDWCFIYTDGSNDKSSYVNLTNGGRGYLYEVSQYEIWNWITENGYHYARITALRTSNSGIISGYWSPDCAGSYRVLNP